MADVSNKKLFEKAKNLSKEKQLSEEAVLGYVGSALLSSKGKVYTGISFTGACGLGFCAEIGAILSMLKNNETKIKKIVAISNDFKYMPPCGRCRELMFQINRKNLNTEIILGKKKIVKLKKLLPNRWQELWE
jgi:cytidine deaminase